LAQRTIIISPLHNEAANVRRLAESVAAQTRPPDLWLAADDGSADETGVLLEELREEVPFLRLLTAPQPADGAPPDRLAAALEIRAFNWALRKVDLDGFDYVGKLDGDIELEPDHFERLLGEFERDPHLGIAGSMLAERPSSRWRVSITPPDHVHGAVKLYSRECLEAIGGLREQLGWDIVDEASARLRGFTTRSVPGLVARHHRLSGSTQGRLRGHARVGESAWIAHYPPLWVLLRSFKMASKPPRLVSGAAFAFGYARAGARRVERVRDDELRRFVRRELWRRLLRPLELLPRGVHRWSS
jgi:biofilm PGA synthesis N-glycosyltransferase PgaC